MILQTTALVSIGGGVVAVLGERLISNIAGATGGENYAILVANAFLIGLLIAVAPRREPLIREQAKPIWAAGIAGGLTTFSSLVWATVSMLPKPTNEESDFSTWQ